MQVGVSTMQNDTEITYLIIMEERDAAVLLHCKQGIKYKSDVNSVTARWRSLSSARTSNSLILLAVHRESWVYYIFGDKVLCFLQTHYRKTNSAKHSVSNFLRA